MNLKLIRQIGRSQRLDILVALKRDGEMAVKELAARFRMSYMGIKQHCLDLEREGYLSTWRRPKPIGRPEMLYRLTPRAEALFMEVHSPLALEILLAVQQFYGPAAPTKLLFGVFQQRAEEYRAKLETVPSARRAKAFAELRSAEGCQSEYIAADTAPAVESGLPGGACIVERQSPIEDVLRRFPIVARLEKELYERVLGLPVTREEDSKPGAYLCIYRLGR